MEITEIIKDAFIFPSTDLAKLAIYIALSFVVGILAILGIFIIALGLSGGGAIYTILGIILFIGAFAVGFILSGYLISIIKSGIELSDDMPTFDWKGNLITGIKYVIVAIVYFIIPAIITLITGWATNMFGMAADMMTKISMAYVNAPANATVDVSTIIPQSQFVALGTAMIVTGIVALVVFLIFAFLQTMGEARLAKTDSLGSALNIVEAFKDIGRIGWGKVIAVIVLIFVIIAVINIIISGINSYINGFGILSIIVTPYLTFFSSRATGLLYSDVE